MKLDTRIALLTVSDRSSAGVREDASGPTMRAWASGLGATVVTAEILPDDPGPVADRLRELADSGSVDLILTSGGTGLSPRDRTPEATSSVVERPVPGIPEWIRATTGANNRFAFLSRGVAGIRGRTLIVNLPGSPKAVSEYLALLEKILPHALQQLRSTPGTPAGDSHPG